MNSMNVGTPIAVNFKPLGQIHHGTVTAVHDIGSGDAAYTIDFAGLGKMFACVVAHEECGLECPEFSKEAILLNPQFPEDYEIMDDGNFFAEYNGGLFLILD